MNNYEQAASTWASRKALELTTAQGQRRLQLTPAELRALLADAFIAGASFRPVPVRRPDCYVCGGAGFSYEKGGDCQACSGTGTRAA